MTPFLVSSVGDVRPGQWLGSLGEMSSILAEYQYIYPYKYDRHGWQYPTGI